MEMGYHESQTSVIEKKTTDDDDDDMTMMMIFLHVFLKRNK